MPSTTIYVDAVLFDMDGTLVDSTAGVAGAWETFKEKYSDIDLHDISNTSTGVRTVDNLKKHCGISDPVELQREAERFETEIIKASTRNGRKGIVNLPGTASIIHELLPGIKLPQPCWAICTSATRKYASAALQIAAIPIPDVFVAAEDVVNGKPSPDPYLLGAQKCGVNAERCLVVEDAPAGLRSAQAAGCKTLGLLTTHSREQMESWGPDFLVKDLTCVSMRRKGNGVEVTVTLD